MTDQTPELRPGVLVEHAKFGLGKVLDVQLANVLVHFRDDNQDTRKLAIAKSLLTWPESTIRLTACLFVEGKFEAGRSARTRRRDRCVQRKIPAVSDGVLPGRASARMGGPPTTLRSHVTTASARRCSPPGRSRTRAARREGRGADADVGKFSDAARRPGTRRPRRPFLRRSLRSSRLRRNRRAWFAAALEISCRRASRASRLAGLTLLPFLAQPHRFMMLKPDPTVASAQRLRFDLQYDASLRWITYERLLTLGDALLDALRPHGARDYIDAHAFLQVLENHE
jgi:hypothetical protein